MGTEEKISAFVWIQIAMATLVQVLLVVFVAGFIVGHYFLTEDSKTVQVAPNGEEISFGTPAPPESWSSPNGDQYNHRVANSDIDAESVRELGIAFAMPIAAAEGSFAGNPVVDENGVAYLQDAAGAVLAVNLETGQEIWKREFEPPAEASNGVTVSNDVVYGCAASSCFALDPESGEEIWKTEALTTGGGGGIDAAPQVHNGILFVQRGGEAIALDASSGEVLWQAGAAGAAGTEGGASAPAIGPEGTVFIASGDSTVALESGSGEALWSLPGAGGISVSPIYSEETGKPVLLTADSTGAVEAIDPKSGKSLWKTQIGAETSSPQGIAANMALDEGALYLVTAGEAGGAIAALDVSSGKALWEAELPAAPAGAVTVADDMLFTALEGGAVVGLSRRSGQVVWEERLPGEAEGSPLIEGDTLVAVSAPAGDEPPQVVAYRLGATEEKEEQEAEETESVTEEAGGEPQSGGEEGEGEGEEGAEGQAEGAEAETGGEGGAAEAGGEALLTEGKSVFTANCATCHTLADAGASGEVGPNLDELMPEKSLVETQVANGGGGMPAFSGVLSQQQIEAVAEYVSTVAGG